MKRFWGDDVKRVTLAELAASPVQDQDHVKAARMTHWDLKIRIAQRIRDFLMLPHKAMANPCVHVVYQKYLSAYKAHERFDNLDSLREARDYWRALAGAFDNNRDVMKLLGHSRLQLSELDCELVPKFDEFLERFSTSRIGSHLTAASFLHQGPAPKGTPKPAGTALGVIQPTQPVHVVRVLVKSLSSSLGESSPAVEIEGDEDMEILYVPSLLRVVLRELVHNALVATHRKSNRRGLATLTPPAAVRIRVHRGRFGVFFTIADQGGGIHNPDVMWSWGRHQIKAEKAVEEHPEDWPEVLAEDPSLAAPIGFGLPMARLTARYFGGDVQMRSLRGYGTTSYIHIPELQREGSIGTHSTDLESYGSPY